MTPNGTLSRGAWTGIVTGLLVLGIWYSATSNKAHSLDEDARRPTIARLGTKPVTFDFHPVTGLLSVRSTDNLFARDLQLSLVVDGEVRPLVVARQDVRARGRDLFGAAVPVEAGEDSFTAMLDLRVDGPSDALVAKLTVVADKLSAPHEVALRMDLPVDTMHAFVHGVGEIADLGNVMGKYVVVDDPLHPVGVTSATGPILVSASHEEGADLGARLGASSRMLKLEPGRPSIFDLRVAVGASSGQIFGRLFSVVGEATAKVKGVVTGTNERSQIFGMDEDGNQIVRVLTDESGRFEVDVPKSVVQWYAALNASHTSAPVNYLPGSPSELRLDVSPGGELHVRITDAETGRPIVARLLVRGIDGTRDPSFGPDYRASGAGPIIDSLKGDVATPLPAGRYRVSATKGPEWSIDAKTVEVLAGHSVDVALAPRHVIQLPRYVGCDLHVHARPSFDSPVSPEDRVLSLVSAGIDFAVPSEHNIVGDYGPALKALDLTGQLGFVTGVEVTTYSPRLGHFHVFPYPLGPPPPYRGTSVGAVFAAARRGDPDRVLQINHPRLPKAIGYFELTSFDPSSAQASAKRTRMDFDTLEVYNGYDIGQPKRVEAVIKDFFALLNYNRRYAATGSSDSHRIQYQWAGYPRTMARVDESQSGKSGQPMDTKAVVAAIKKGRSFVTSGPMVEVDAGGVLPGEELQVKGDTITLHLVVRAAPWVDVTSADVIIGGETVKTVTIPSKPTQTGPEPGTKEEVMARMVRFDQDVTVNVRPTARWLVVIVRGDRPMDDVLPFMPHTPLALTNPIWLVR
jgi:hypothetical protein